MEKTIVAGVFDRMEDARMAVLDLVRHGISREDIRLLINQRAHTVDDYFDRKEYGQPRMMRTEMEQARPWSIMGGLAGLLSGFVLSYTRKDIRFAWRTAAAFMGAIFGAITGSIIGASASSRGFPIEIKEYQEEGKPVSNLVIVNTLGKSDARALDILNQYQPRDAKRRTIGRRQDHFTRAHKEDVRTEARMEDIDLGGQPQTRATLEEEMGPFQEGTIEMTLQREEVVVDKESHVVEEVEVRKLMEEHEERISETVRRSGVDVTRVEPEAVTSTMGPDEDDLFQSHFTTSYAGTDYSYADYRPYYQYGYELADEVRYRDFREQDWGMVEQDARRMFEQSHTGSKWSEVKDAVRAGWEARKQRKLND